MNFQLYKLYKLSSGFVLIPTILITALLLTIGLYFLTFTISEKNISSSYSISQQAYYLAESGLEYAIWKLKNDPSWENNFETNPNWSAIYTGGSALFSNGQYNILVENYDLAKATIYATSTLSINDKTSQRVIKTQVFKAMGNSILEDITAYGQHDMETSNSEINIYNGGLHTNHDFKVKNNSTIYIEKDLSVVHDYDKDVSSTVTVDGNIYSQDNPPQPENIDMPAIDFDSNYPNSYKNKANIVYDEDDFEDLMEDNQTLILNNDITYVKHDVELKGGQNLIINGLLVIEHDLKIGNKQCWKSRCGYSTLTINNTQGKASGILVKHKIEFDEWTGGVNANGLIYAYHDIKIDNLPAGYAFNIIGAIISGHDFNINNSVRIINITENSATFLGVIGPTDFSPIIIVEHWEEEY